MEAEGPGDASSTRSGSSFPAADAAAFAAAAAPAEDAFATATLPELRKALYIRGLACEDCHRQALETMARDHAKTPIDLELEALHEASRARPLLGTATSPAASSSG